MMNRRLTSALAALLLLVGCSAPPEPKPEPQPAPPPVGRPQPQPPQTEPPGAPPVEQAGEGVLVRGVRAEYRWFAAGRRLAVQTRSGLWSVSPEGEALELLAPAGPDRTLVGPYEDGLVYLEQHPGALVAYVARPGQPPRQVAVVAHKGVERSGFPIWGAVSGSRLTVALEGRRPAAIDLATGKVTDLGDEAVPVRHGELHLAPNGRYLAYKQGNRGDAVRVLDLESGAVFRPADEAHLPGVAWSPSGGQWAVRAAKVGSGLPAPVGANLEEGGTHLDLGDVKGGLRHLEPPVALELPAGPWWSPDSKWLAVVSGTVQVTPGQPEPPQRVWVVEAATGEWHRLGTLPAGGFVTGFHPGGRHLMVNSKEGLHLWPLSGEKPLPVPLPWIPGPNSPMTLPGSSLLYLSVGPLPGLYLQKPDGDPVALLADTTPMGNLTTQGQHLALILYRDGLEHDLLILPLPD